MQLVTADARWAGRRCFVAASGPSLTEEVAAAISGELVIAVNDAYHLLPHASVLYACDAAWWDLHHGVPNFCGERWTSHSLRPANDKRHVAGQYDLHVIEGVDRPGFSRVPGCVHYGNNSGFQAVNLAVLFAADPIILTGFDMREVNGYRHFFGNHKAPLRDGMAFSVWIQAFAKAAQMLGPSPRIINATPASALNCFEMMALDRALDQRVAIGGIGPIRAHDLRLPKETA
jgi:hypothetical protein